jgi:hypothetical protein
MGLGLPAVAHLLHLEIALSRPWALLGRVRLYKGLDLGNHPKSDIRKALSAAKSEGLSISENINGHRWGELTCSGCGQSLPIHHSPRNPSVFARRVDEFVRRHRKH